ncbi:hypothetical protein SAMN02910298_01196 [Pseudobutyrivibrio sp. YE44]|uniref:hypothetical protein n=1 Tax=Pseudobutyrivibrio sp. YE44 TaxID=1520802 RepID=UPI00088B0125|nr:hypothetical protein [Pseudobutyrivibrio sp. YE44]SDB24143.1 hypothetical protein SAMN02910298_01196 [Pseudobutyrivibrio sp. YE44]
MNSLTDLLNIVNTNYKLTPLDTSKYEGIKVSGMKFDIKAFKAEGLGHVSIMSARGFFGLMKMDTLIINPTELDLPLYSYDRILAMGNDTLIIELYNTMNEDADLSSLDTLKSAHSHLPLRDPGTHWYDNIKLPCSLSFKGKKATSPEFDALTTEHLKSFLATPNLQVTDNEAKKEKALFYINGLLEHGGPSTDVFVKALGPGATATLFHDVLFGI